MTISMTKMITTNMMIDKGNDEDDGQPTSSLRAGTPALHCVGLHLTIDLMDEFTFRILSLFSSIAFVSFHLGAFVLDWRGWQRGRTRRPLTD